MKALEDEVEVIMDDQDATVAELAERDIQLSGMIAERDGLQTQVEGLEGELRAIKDDQDETAKEQVERDIHIVNLAA